MTPKTRAADAPSVGALDDPRIRAFLAPGGPEVFHAIAHRHEICLPDPLDVETIHEEAREAFRRLVDRATMTPRPTSGRILLVLGESGSGKTHLMRAFRNGVHGRHAGYCGYMQMTSATDHYGRYILNNLVDSLSQPYYDPPGETTGLMRLSTALAESSRHVPRERLSQLRDDELDASCLAKLIDALADQIIADDRFHDMDLDLDLVRALLYLQRDDPRLRARVLKYLRCEGLSDADKAALGGLEPRTYPHAYDEAPMRVVELLGQLMGSVESVPLVLCVDQLEDIYNFDDGYSRFRRAMSTVCAVAGRVPSSVVVISCLQDFYEMAREHLATPARARIEEDPKPILLKADRDLSEVVQIVTRRLEALYEPHGVAIDPADPTYPIPVAEIKDLAGLPTRNILNLCREFRERCMAEGRVVAGLTPPARPTPAAPAPDPIRLEQLWNDARSAPGAAVPSDDSRLAELLAGAIEACAAEAATGAHFSAEVDGTLVLVERQAEDQSVDRLLVGICNKSAQGGALGKQVAEIERRVDHAMPVVTPVIVRSSEFPASPKALVSRQLGEMIARGGRRVVVEDSDWRAFLAMRSFRQAHQADPDFLAWLAREKPLSRLKSLRKILDLDGPRGVLPAPENTLPRPPVRQLEAIQDGRPAVDMGPLVVGTTGGLQPGPVTITAAELTMHAAFLGAPGSGKTTVALAIIEQLLLRGIPAILVDRKGDLCRYADPAAWASPSSDPDAEARRLALRDRVDVAVYTPGESGGRPLSIAAVPAGLGAMPSAERKQAAQYAASALCGMMKYKAGGADGTRLVILAEAMDLLSQSHPEGGVTLAALIELIAEADPALIHAIGRLDTKHFDKLVEDLETLRLSKGKLLASQGEPLDAATLLGLGPHAVPGKTRLSVVSTKFLGDNQDIQFWVAQFLMEMARWTSRSPSKDLQAAVLLDEADLYLPAVGKPPTKGPMEDLLKRARSAGLGLMLATQSPGDFDYKCRENIRSWFVGRVKEPNALAKMKPMWAECRVDVESRLPGQSAGQFHLLRAGEVTSLRAGRSVVATEQLPEAEILALARRTLHRDRPGGISG